MHHLIITDLSLVVVKPANYLAAQPPTLLSFRASPFHCPICRRLSNILVPLPRNTKVKRTQRIRFRSR